MVEKTTVSKPDDLLFSSIVDSYVHKNARFLRRDWLADNVNDLMETPGCRFVLLTAEPGAGKSTFIAQLAHDHPEWPRYFIRRDQRESLSSAGARSFLMRIGFQLAKIHPELFFSDHVELDVEQDSERIEEEGQLSGIEIEELIASPFYKSILKVRQSAKRIAGSMTGIRIQRLIAEPELLSLDDLQNQALFAPARVFRKNAPGTRIVILVDALDELRFHDQRDNILHWLTHCPTGDLPDNVRFVLTSRPPDLNLKQFTDEQKHHLQSIYLEILKESGVGISTIEKHLRNDVETYANGLVKEDALAGYWKKIGKKPQDFTAEAVKKSEGNLGYLDLIARSLDQAQNENTINALLSLTELPEDLKALYAFFLIKIRETVSHQKTWRKIYMRILGVLSVAQEPLRLSQIICLGGIKAERSDVASAFDRLRQFLDIIEDRFRLYHTSLSEFLMSQSVKESADWAIFSVDAAKFHRRLARAYQQLARVEAGEDGKRQQDWTKCDLYGLKYLPFHLEQASQISDLKDLLTDFNWLQTKLDVLEVTDLISDTDRAPVDADMRQVGEALRLSMHVLVNDKAQLWSQLYGRLLDKKSPGIEKILAMWPEELWLRPLRSSLTAPGGSLLGFLVGHTRGVEAVAVYDGGRRAISASWDNTIKIWDLERGQALNTLKGHRDSVWAVAVYNNGQRAISGSKDKTLKIWDLESGQVLRTLEGHRDSIMAVAILNDGQKAISASRDSTLMIWDLEGNQKSRILKSHRKPIRALAVNKDGRWAISASQDKTLKVWNLESDRVLRTLKGHRDSVVAVTLFGNGRWALSASGDDTLRIWDLEGDQKPRILDSHTRGVWSLTVYNDGRRAISGSVDGTIKIWDLVSGDELGMLSGHADAINAVAVYNDDRRAISASSDGTLRIWDLTRDQILRTSAGNGGWVLSMAMYHNGQRAISGSLDGTLKIWDLTGGEGPETLLGHTREVLSIFVYDDGRRAISASRDNTLRIWDLTRREELYRLDNHNQWANAVAVYKEGRRAISASSDGTLRIWNLEQGEEIDTLSDHHDGQVHVVTVYGDGQRAVSASVDGVLKIWDLARGRTLHTLEGDADGVHVVVYDGERQAISASQDGTLRIWDLSRREELRVLRGHTDGINAVVVYADGQRAISASQDKTLRIWDLKNGKTIRTLEGHSASVAAVVVSKGEQWAVSASIDCTLRVWNLETGVSLATYWSDQGLTTCLVTPDGQTVVAGDAGGQLHVLRLEGGEMRRKVGKRTRVTEC